MPVARPSAPASRRRVAALTLLLLALAACDDGSASDDPPADATVEEVEPAADEPDEADEAAAAGPARPDLELPGVELTAPASGQGPRPELTWEPVDDAATYAVTLYAGPEAPAVWSWRGEDTSVRVGFVDDATAGGPNVTEGMTWAVIALDADDEPIAQSEQRRIGP